MFVCKSRIRVSAASLCADSESVDDGTSQSSCSSSSLSLNPSHSPPSLGTTVVVAANLRFKRSVFSSSSEESEACVALMVGVRRGARGEEGCEG